MFSCFILSIEIFQKKTEDVKFFPKLIVFMYNFSNSVVLWLEANAFLINSMNKISKTLNPKTLGTVRRLKKICLKYSL